MPVTCDSWPSTTATCSCSSRSVRSRRLANARSFLHQPRVQLADPLFEADGRRECEALAQCRIDGVKLNELFGVAFVRHMNLGAKEARHRADDMIDADRPAGREVDRS